jgi:hypothetical protein
MIITFYYGIQSILYKIYTTRLKKNQLNKMFSMNKPTTKINVVGEVNCFAWSKCKENLFACSCINDIRIYDIRVKNRNLCLIIIKIN